MIRRNAYQDSAVPAWTDPGSAARQPARALAAAMRRALRRARVWPRAAAVAALGGALLACPIQRPPVPTDYFEFREALRATVAEAAESELAGRPASRSRLQERMPELAAQVETDSLLATLAADSLLSPLTAVVRTALDRALESRGVSGGVRKAFRKPDGQRLAVDAILIGLGQALRRLDATDARPPP